jgi:deoxyadenosine/deoxycytidine kinase
MAAVDNHMLNDNRLPLDGRVVIIEGPICAGKSTMLRTFRKYAVTDLNSKPIKYVDENVDLCLIEDYKRDMATLSNIDERIRRAMILQINIMKGREKTMANLVTESLAEHKSVVVERGTVGNLVFALNLFEMYKLADSIVSEFAKYMISLLIQYQGGYTMPPNHVVLFIRNNIDDAVRLNIQRDRDQPYTAAYLHGIQQLYNLILDVYPASNVILFDVSDVAQKLNMSSTDDLVEVDTDTGGVVFKRVVYEYVQQLFRCV